MVGLIQKGRRLVFSKAVYKTSLCGSLGLKSPVILSYLEQFEDEFFGQGSDFGWNVIFVVLDACVCVLECLGLEGGLPHQEGVEDAPQRPDVHLVAVALLLQDFGGNVVGGAAKRCYSQK